QLTDTFGKLGSKLEMAHDVKNEIGTKYGASGFPTMVVVGKSGKIEAVNVGNVADLETRLPGQLDALIAGRPLPKVAKAPPRPTPKRADALIGKPAPAFSLTTFDGKTVSNAEFAKHPATVLNFVATNCGYCGKQIPRLEKLRQTYDAKGVRFVNVVETMRQAYSKDQVLAKMTSLGSKLEVAHDPPNKVGTLFSARGFPTMVIVGRDGKVAATNIGNLADLEKRVNGQLTALIDGKPLPKFASARPSSRRPAQDMVGKPTPSFSVTTLDGKKLANADFAKYPATVMNFVAPNCGYCKRALPNVEKVRKEYESKGVRFINVVQKMRQDFTNDQIVDVFKKVGSNLEISTTDFGSNSIGRLFKATSYPTMFVVDRSGKIANVNIGAKANLESMLKGQLDALLK
ncbi:MAG: redoxin family protein, partial [Phycisphaerae bacterium]